MRKISYVLFSSLLLFSLNAEEDCHDCSTGKMSGHPKSGVISQLSSAVSNVEKKRSPASVDCAPKIGLKKMAYAYSPYHRYTNDCRNHQRRYSLHSRDLETTSDEKYFWSQKDEIQKLRDKIREEAVKVGFDVLDFKDKNIDVTKNPYIAKLLKDYKSKLSSLKKEQLRLKKKFKKSNHKRYMAYVEQGLIIDIKDESFKMTLAAIRSRTISVYMIKNNEEQKKDWETILHTKDGKLLYETVKKVLDRAKDDERDPMKHVDHYLNNTLLTAQAGSVLSLDRCPKKKEYCRGYNKSGTLIVIPGQGDEYQTNFTKLLVKNMLQEEREGRELNTKSGILEIYSGKEVYSETLKKKKFQDYSGVKLYKQTIAMRTFDETHNSNEIPWNFPESAKNDEHRNRLKAKFDVENLTPEEKELLSNSNSLENHMELKSDISKWYMGVHKHRQYFEAKAEDEPEGFSSLKY